MNGRLCLTFTFALFCLAQSSTSVQKAVLTSPGFLEPCVFYKEYVLKSIPVVMKSALSEMINGLDVSSLSTDAEYFTTYLEVRKKDDVTTRNLSIYQIWDTHEADNSYVNTFIPTTIKSRIHLPKSLLSKGISQGMRSTRLAFSSGEMQWDVVLHKLHGFLCQFGGHSSHHLVAPFAIISQNDQSLPLAASEHYTAVLNKGDCIFIPSGWAQQKNSTGKYLSISLYWTSDPEENACEEEHTTDNLARTLFTDDPPLDLLSVIQFTELHHFLKEYFLPPNLMDLNSFIAAVKQDNHFAEVPDWDEECEDIVKEMFNQLDYNSDGVLSKEDFREISKEGVQELAGKLEDRFADLADVIEDAKVEKKGSLFTEARKATNSAEDIRKLIEDSFSEILSDIDTAKMKGDFKNAETDPGKDETTEETKRIENLLKDSIASSSTSNKDEL